MRSARYSCPILIKPVFPRHILEKTININFMKIRPVGAEVFHADGQDEGKSSFSQFCERV